MRKRRVTVFLLPSGDDGYAAFVPLFPDCTTEGNTVEEALKNATEALELALEEQDPDDLERLELSHVPHVVVSEIEVAVPEPSSTPR